MHRRNPVLHKRVVERVQHYVTKANELWNLGLAMPRITYLVRGTCGGKAYHSEYRVDFNADLLVRNVEDYMSDTIPHEVAHLVAQTIFKKDPMYYYARKKNVGHGPLWKQVMVAFGCDPKRCHSYDTSETKVRSKPSYTYTCGCHGKTYSLGPKRHARQTRDPETFYCRRCKVYLKPAFENKVLMPTVAKPVVQPSTPSVPTFVPPSTVSGSKKDRAQAIMRLNSHADRATIINLFMTQLSMSKAGANTYYYNLSK